MSETVNLRRSREGAACGLVAAGYLLAFGLPGLVAVQILVAWDRGGYPDWIVVPLQIALPAGFLVTAAALLIAWRGLGYGPRELGLGLRPLAARPSLGGVAAVGAAYLTMWIAFTVMHLFPPVPGGTSGERNLGWELLANLHSGVVEEILLLALPVAVMSRLRWPWQAHLAVLVVLRVPFHLYYGYGAVALGLIWMAGWLFLYRRVGIVWPFMLAHFLYNSAHAGYLPNGFRPLMGLALLALGVVAFWKLFWHSRTSRSERGSAAG